MRSGRPVARSCMTRAMSGVRHNTRWRTGETGVVAHRERGCGGGVALTSGGSGYKGAEPLGPSADPGHRGALWPVQGRRLEELAAL
jgi:hypothetical protein